MASSEIRTTVMIAVSAILLASLLGFIAFLIGVRGDFAEVRNNEIYASEAISFQKEFNKFYEDQFGVDVIATIRDYYKSGMEIEVKSSSDSTIYHINKPNSPSLDPNMVTMDYLFPLFPSTKEYTVDLELNSSSGVDKIVFKEK